MKNIVHAALIAINLTLGAVVLSSAFAADSASPSANTQPASQPSTQPESKETPLTAPASKPANANPVVIIETSMGDIKAELWPDKAPATVKNFLDYTDQKFYDDLIFHRVISGFMIQGGGFTADMQQKRTAAPIKNEARTDVPNARGTLAMARTSDIDSATAQFFINHKNNDFLNHRNNSQNGFGYCVFGKVIEGMDVVDKIAAVRTGSKGPFDDVPVQPVIIKSIRKAP